MVLTVYEHVDRLEISVDDPLLMNVTQAFNYFPQQPPHSLLVLVESIIYGSSVTRIIFTLFSLPNSVLILN